MSERELIIYMVGVLEGVNACVKNIDLSGPTSLAWDILHTPAENPND